ncbi:MAG: hypothetical protein DHS20C15_32550 [Planctomycetota bacterium]|nr:MAG: hypothetical protein DHS20C15_32550 [Planctomycetota bacterium]
MPPESSTLHPLLLRQLSRIGADPQHTISDAAHWEQLLQRVSRSYHQADDDRYTLERSLQISSDEMQELYDTLRQVSESQLSAEKRKLEAVVSALGDGLCVLDVAGRLQFMNPAASALLGWSQDDLHEVPVLELLRSNEIATGSAIFDRLAREGVVRCETSRIQLSDGSLLPISFVLNPILDGEQVVGAVLAFRDMTEPQAARLALQTAKEDAEIASHAKSEFLATMSHEIRTPMNGVIGMIAMLRETELTPLQRDYAETVHSSGTALLSIINDILDFSKIEAGKLELERIDFELDTIVDDVVELFAESAFARDLSFDSYVASNLPRHVVGDPGRIRQVLTNLISNALKFTRRGGVRVELSNLRSDADRCLLRVAVTDTGVGIAAERQRRLFQPFSQTDSSTTREFGGTGLGLAICKRLVEAMGGEVGMQSTAGQGSCFWFTVALESVASERAPRAPVDDLHVVLLDSADSPQHSLRARLERLGAKVLPAEQHADGLARVRALDTENRLLVLPLNDQDSVLLDELGRDPQCRSVKTLLTGQTGDLPLEALSRHPRFGAFLRMPARAQSLRDTLCRLFRVNELHAERARTEQVDTEPVSLRSAQVLLVEDNIVNQKVACHMLERFEQRVQVAANGLEALTALQRQRFDLVLMDCQMPEMDGFETTRHIREREQEGERLPIIAMTANALKGDRERCLAAGMDDYLSKPVRPHDLEAMLQRWIGTGVAR